MSSAAFRAERRWSRRLVCDLTARILRDGVPTERGCGQNLGLEGMFVALDTTSYSLREVMEVIFTYPDVDGQPVPHRITSAVSHVDVSGIGIQFMRFDPSLFRTVQLILEQPSRR